MKIIHYPDPGVANGKYDRCVDASPNGTVYALSWYLDITCPDWEFLSTEDFSTVMPIPVIKKFNRKIIKQPDFTFQLGVFSRSIPDPRIVHTFLKNIPAGYRLKTLYMSKFNVIESSYCRYHNSFELDLIRPYPFISASFSPKIREELDKAEKASLSYIGNTAANDFLMFASRSDEFNIQKLKTRGIDLSRIIMTQAIRYRSGQIVACYDVFNNLCATMFFLKYHGRISIHHAAASKEGIRSGALYYLMDAYIRQNAEQDLVLCIDDPHASRLSEIFLHFGASPSSFPSVKSLQ